LALFLGACDGDSEGDDDDPSGGSAGTATGGSSGASGSSSQGGNSGGVTGGSATGGNATGGSATGGTAQCGGGNGSFTPGAVEALNDYCAMRAAHVAACGTPDDDATCPEVSCVERLYASDGFITYAECQMQKECTAFLATDDDCFEAAGGPLTPEIEEFVSFCDARLDECAPDYSDDLCAVVSPAIHRNIFCAVDACLRGSCDAMPSCLEPVVAEFPDCW
jgi:hypothetical protein